jgi:pimeloyl-ACP methyl ester carboxylesterase
MEILDIAGQAPALVFLHEGLGSIELWRSFPADLAAATGRRGLVYDRAGHGRTPAGDGARTPRFMHDEALIHASEHPVTAVVAISPHVFVEELSVASIREARDAFATTDLRERMARYHDDPETTFRLWNDIWLAPEFRDWNIEDVLPGITAPVLAIQGEHDQYGTMAQIDAIEAGVSGSFERVVLDARHAPHLEAPEETLAATTRFVLR